MQKLCVKYDVFYLEIGFYELFALTGKRKKISKSTENHYGISNWDSNNDNSNNGNTIIRLERMKNENESVAIRRVAINCFNGTLN